MAKKSWISSESWMTPESSEFNDNSVSATTFKWCVATWKDLEEILLQKEKEEKNQKIQECIQLEVDEWWDGQYLLKKINRYKDWTFNNDTAKKLIDAWFVEVLSYSLKKFEKLDKEIAENILDSKYWYNVACNLEVFEWVDHNQLALRLLQERRNENLSENLGKFKGLSKETAKIWLDTGYYTNIIPHHLDSFVWLDKEILLKLVRNSSWLYMLEEKKSKSLKLFSWLDKEVAMKIFENSHYIPISWVLENIDQFEWLDEEIANMLTEKGFWKFVEQHPEKFWLKKEK